MERERDIEKEVILNHINRGIDISGECDSDYSAQSKTGRFLFNKPSIRGRKVGLLLDNYLRTSGICTPEIHLSKDLGTAKTIINNAIKDNYLILEVKKNL